jgi:hypothetical protein
VFIVVIIVLLFFLNKKLDTIPPHSNPKDNLRDEEEVLTSTEYTDYTDYTSNDLTPYSSDYSTE